MSSIGLEITYPQPYTLILRSQMGRSDFVMSMHGHMTIDLRLSSMKPMMQMEPSGRLCVWMMVGHRGGCMILEMEKVEEDIRRQRQRSGTQPME